MIFDENGLPRDTGSSDWEDSARLAGLMWLVDHPKKPKLSYYFDENREPRRNTDPKYGMSRDQCVCLISAFYGKEATNYVVKIFLHLHPWHINKDIFSPSVRNHFRLCAGLPGTWLGYQWLHLDIWWNGKFGKIDTEQNQLLCMCIIAGPEWVKRYVKANPKWRDQTNYYWRDSFRQEPELAKMLIKKVEEVI